MPVLWLNEPIPEAFKHYRTAFDPLHHEYVKIIKIRHDDSRNMLIDAEWIDGTEMTYRLSELIDYVL